MFAFCLCYLILSLVLSICFYLLFFVALLVVRIFVIVDCARRSKLHCMCFGGETRRAQKWEGLPGENERGNFSASVQKRVFFWEGVFLGADGKHCVYKGFSHVWASAFVPKTEVITGPRLSS